MLLIGLIGNTIGVIVFTKKSFMSFPIRIVFIIDACMNMASLIFYYFIFAFNNLNPTRIYNVSIRWCKMGYFFLYLFNSIDRYILVFISIGRLLTVKYSDVQFFQYKWFQLLIICIIVFYNIKLYSPTIFFVTLINQTNTTAKCDFIETETDNLMSL